MAEGLEKERVLTISRELARAVLPPDESASGSLAAPTGRSPIAEALRDYVNQRLWTTRDHLIKDMMTATTEQPIDRSF
jgi:hypothetical protein